MQACGIKNTISYPFSILLHIYTEHNSHGKILACEMSDLSFSKTFCFAQGLFEVKKSFQKFVRSLWKITSFALFLIQNGSCAMVNTQYDSQDMIEDIILDFFVSNRNVKIWNIIEFGT